MSWSRPGTWRSRLDVNRAPHHNLALGHGIHLCMGRTLVLIELEVVFGTLFRRVPTLRLAVPLEGIPFKQDENVLGAHEVPITWEPAPVQSSGREPYLFRQTFR